MEPDSQNETDEQATETVPPGPASQEPAAVPAPTGGSVAAEVLSAALSSALLFALFLLLPLAGSVALAFAGVPLVRVAHRRGVRAGLLGAAISAGLLAGIGAATGGASDATAGAILASVAMGLPVLSASLVRRGASASAAFLILGVVGFGVLAGGLLVREHTGGRPVGQEIAVAFDSMTPSTGPATAKGVDPETAARMAATMIRFKEFAQTYWPGLVGASWLLAAAVAFYTGALAARPAPSAERVRFEELRVPAPAVALFVASGGGFALLSGTARAVAGDLLLPLLALYFLTGLSIICHFARRWFRARILRAGLYALVVYFPLNVGVGLLGLFDWYADFRRRGQKV